MKKVILTTLIALIAVPAFAATQGDATALLEVVLKVFLVTLALQVLFSTTYLLVLLLSSLSLFMV